MSLVVIRVLYCSKEFFVDQLTIDLLLKFEKDRIFQVIKSMKRTRTKTERTAFSDSVTDILEEFYK